MLIPFALGLMVLIVITKNEPTPPHILNIGNGDYITSFGNYSLTPQAISLLKIIYWDNQENSTSDTIDTLREISINQYNSLIDKKLTNKYMDDIFHVEDIKMQKPLFLISKMSYNNGNADIYGFISELSESDLPQNQESDFDISLCNNGNSKDMKQCIGLKHYHLSLPVTLLEYMQIHYTLEIQKSLLGHELNDFNESIPQAEPMKLLNINIIPEDKLYVSENIHIIDGMSDEHSKWYANGGYSDIMNKLMAKDFSMNNIQDKNDLLYNNDYLYIHSIKALKDHKYQIDLNRLPGSATTYGPHYIYSITTTLSENDAKALSQLETLQHSLFHEYDQTYVKERELNHNYSNVVIINNNNVSCDGDDCSTETSEEDSEDDQNNMCTPQTESDDSNG